MRYLITVFSLLITAVSCQNSGSRKAVPVSDNHEVVVNEILQANNYTYLRVDEKGREKWIAVPSMIASVGDIYYYTGGMVMENFESKDLGRTFESVLFLEQLYSTPPSYRGEAVTEPEEISEDQPHAGVVEPDKLNITVDPAEGGITIAELYSGKKSYNGKIVRIRGAVTKFNPSIMERNWIHLQDGSEFEGKFDLTVTSDEVVDPGSVITVEGKLSLDKDFGFGYYYEILLEDARVTGN